MLPLPWTTHDHVAPDAEIVVMASLLPLATFHRMPAFLLWTQRMRRQLAVSPGLVGYALKADLLSKRFWTVSAWTSTEALRAFNVSDPHAAGVATIRPWMGRPAFTTWTARGSDLPVDWRLIRMRLQQGAPPSADRV